MHTHTYVHKLSKQANRNQPESIKRERKRAVKLKKGGRYNLL